LREEKEKRRGGRFILAAPEGKGGVTSVMPHLLSIGGKEKKEKRRKVKSENGRVQERREGKRTLRRGRAGEEKKKLFFAQLF